MALFKSRIGSTLRVGFKVKFNGALLAGQVANLTVQVLSPTLGVTTGALTVVAAPALAGFYYVDVPSTFFAANGLGPYLLVVVWVKPPPMPDSDAKDYPLEITTRDLDDLSFHSAADVWAVATRTLTSIAAVMDTQGYTAARAAFLDEAISAAKILTAGQVTSLVDAFWDEDVVSAHGAASSGGLLLRALGAAISVRANNPTLDALLGVPDTPATTVGDAINTILTAAHGAGAWTGSSAASVADAVWDELRAAHVVVGSFGEALQQPVATAEANILAAVAALNDLSSGDVDAAITANAVVTLLRKVLTNKRVTNDTTGKLEIWNDANTAIEFTIDLFEDVAETQPYQGAGANVQEQIV